MRPCPNLGDCLQLVATMCTAVHTKRAVPHVAKRYPSCHEPLCEALERGQCGGQETIRQENVLPGSGRDDVNRLLLIVDKFGVRDEVSDRDSYVTPSVAG